MVRICSTAVGCGTAAAGRGGTASPRYHTRGLWWHRRVPLPQPAACGGTASLRYCGARAVAEAKGQKNRSWLSLRNFGISTGAHTSSCCCTRCTHRSAVLVVHTGQLSSPLSSPRCISQYAPRSVPAEHLCNIGTWCSVQLGLCNVFRENVTPPPRLVSTVCGPSSRGDLCVRKLASSMSKGEYSNEHHFARKTHTSCSPRGCSTRGGIQRRTDGLDVDVRDRGGRRAAGRRVDVLHGATRRRRGTCGPLRRHFRTQARID